MKVTHASAKPAATPKTDPKATGTANSKDSKSTAQKATDLKNASDSKKDLARVEARNVAREQLAKKAEAEKSKPAVTAEPAFVVSVSKRELTEDEMKEREETKGYSPAEMRAKTKALLESGNLPPEQREVLGKILKGEEEKEHQQIKAAVKAAKK